MRRWFNCLLIGVLTCSLLVDTAKACWYRRHAHAHAARGYSRPACPPVATWPACHDVVVSDSACGSGLACGSVVIVDGWRDDVCCGGDSGIVVDAAESVTVAESVVAPNEPTIAAEPAAAQAEPIVAPQNGIAAVAPAVPELKPAVDSPAAVEPVVALEPAPVEPATEPAPAEPAPEPAAPQPEPVATVESPVPPAEPNIFEEVESAADAAILAPAGAEPLAEPSAPSTDRSADNLFGEPEAATEPAAAPVADPPAEPSAAEPALGPEVDGPEVDASEPAAEPVAEPAADAAPATEEPASQPAAEEADPFSDASREPLRRWVDDTGRYATVGMLVDVRAEGVEIRKANGRTVIVPLDRLSEHDRAYAADAEARLAADRAPSSRETVGL